jgi:hypothetical protein
VVQIKRENDRRLGGKVGVDFETVEIRDDEERRVLQVLPVEEELLIGLEQAAALAFVFPGEVALPPDVGPALAAAGLVDAALERVPGALRIGGRRLGLARAARRGRGNAAARRCARRVAPSSTWR